MVSSTKSGSRFKIIVAVLIALVAVVGAVAAWRSALIDDEAGDEDFAGLAAVINAQETHTSSNSMMYANYRAYTAYVRYNELGNLIDDDLPDVSESEADTLEHQMQEAWTLAIGASYFFPNRYLNRDGTYDTDRELGEAWADAAQQKDLYPEQHFARADRLRAKSSWLVAVIVLLTVSVWFYTLAEGIDHPVKYVLALGGTGFLLLGAATAVVQEILR